MRSQGMWILFQEGGYPMWLLLALSLATLVAAGRFAFQPGGRRLRVCLALALATLCSIGTGVAADLSAVGHRAPEYLRNHPGMTLAEVVLEGVGESMSPAIFGFTLLGMAALIVAYGLAREVQS
ncbi:MAG: hypothetical protein ACOY0T_16500 [Myxococcota bacterium]